MATYTIRDRNGRDVTVDAEVTNRWFDERGQLRRAYRTTWYQRLRAWMRTRPLRISVNISLRIKFFPHVNESLEEMRAELAAVQRRLDETIRQRSSFEGRMNRAFGEFAAEIYGERK